MELLAHYKSFIETVPGTIVDERGHVLAETAEGLKPVIHEGKEVVLPTPEFLANPDWNKQMPFHPMCESIARGESDIIHLCQKLVRLSLWDRFVSVATTLLLIAADQSLQAKLTPSQQKYLSPIKDADATTLENFQKIIAKSRHDYSDGQDRRILAVFLRRGGTQNGQQYSRMFVVKFPLYEALCKAEEAKDAKDRKVFDVALRVKDIPILKALHETIFPGDDSVYTIGTNSNLAPYYTALLNGYANMARQLNNVMKPFIKASPSLKLIDLSWDEGDNLTAFRNKIPPLPHNEGNDPVADPNVAGTPVQQPPAPPVAQPMQQQAPVNNIPPHWQSAPMQQYQNPVPQQQPQQQPQSTTPTATIGSSKPQHQAPAKTSWSELAKSGAVPQPQPPMPQGYGYGPQPMMMQNGVMMQPPYQAGMIPQQQQFMPQQQMQMQMPVQQQQFGYQQPMMQQYQPVMTNGMPQPPMPQTTQPQPPQFSQQPMQMQMPMQQMQMQQMPMQQFMPQQQFGYPQQQGVMMQPGMQQGMMQPQFSFVQR